MNTLKIKWRNQKMVNKVILVGRLVADPELSYSGRGVAYTKFTLAVNTGYGEYERVDFIDVVTFGSAAENHAQYLEKGRLVYVEGSIKIDSYEDKQGIRRKATTIQASTVTYLSYGRVREVEEEKPVINKRRGNNYTKKK